MEDANILASKAAPVVQTAINKHNFGSSALKSLNFDTVA